MECFVTAVSESPLHHTRTYLFSQRISHSDVVIHINPVRLDDDANLAERLKQAGPKAKEFVRRLNQINGLAEPFSLRPYGFTLCAPSNRCWAAVERAAFGALREIYGFGSVGYLH